MVLMLSRMGIIDLLKIPLPGINKQLLYILKVQQVLGFHYALSMMSAILMMKIQLTIILLLFLI